MMRLCPGCTSRQYPTSVLAQREIRGSIATPFHLLRRFRHTPSTLHQRTPRGNWRVRRPACVTENEPENPPSSVGGCMGSPRRGCSGGLLVLDWVLGKLVAPP